MMKYVFVVCVMSFLSLAVIPNSVHAGELDSVKHSSGKFIGRDGGKYLARTLSTSGGLAVAKSVAIKAVSPVLVVATGPVGIAAVVGITIADGLHVAYKLLK